MVNLGRPRDADLAAGSNIGSRACQRLHPLQVPCKYVDLEIDLIAGAQRAKRCHFAGMRNDV